MGTTLGTTSSLTRHQVIFLTGVLAKGSRHFPFWLRLMARLLAPAFDWVSNMVQVDE